VGAYLPDAVSEAAQPENAGRNPDGRFAKGNAINLAGKPKGVQTLSRDSRQLGNERYGLRARAVALMERMSSRIALRSAMASRV
jgi:hypothetical protein